MNDITRLRDIVIEFFAKGTKAYELEGVCPKYGVECDKTLALLNSKRVYLKSGFTKKNLDQLKDIVRQITFEGCGTSFVRDVEPFLNDDFFYFYGCTTHFAKLVVCTRNIESFLGDFRLLTFGRDFVARPLDQIIFFLLAILRNRWN